MNKKGLTPGILVGVIAVVAALTVTLVMVVPKLTEVLFTSGEQSQCQFNLLISKAAETATFGFGKEMPVECKTTRKTITQNDLARYTALASQSISKYPPNSEAAKTFSDTQEGKDKWALANIIANDMKSCYDRGWRGQLKIGEAPALKGIFGGLGSDFLCILCTRYTFDSGVAQVAQNPFLLKSWAETNIAGQKTFYDYLTNDGQDALAVSTISKSQITTKEPLTVLFLANSKGEGGAYIAPYSVLTSDIGLTVQETAINYAAGAETTAASGYKSQTSTYTVRQKCKYIIGD